MKKGLTTVLFSYQGVRIIISQQRAGKKKRKKGSIFEVNIIVSTMKEQTKILFISPTVTYPTRGWGGGTIPLKHEDGRCREVLQPNPVNFIRRVKKNGKWCGRVILVVFEFLDQPLYPPTNTIRIHLV